MRKKLLRKSAFLLLLGGTMLSSCIDKDYDFDNFDDETVLKDVSLGIPFGSIKYTLKEIADKANFNHKVVSDEDTLFLIYDQTLEFTSNGTTPNIKSQYINIFNDIAEEGSVLYFSNPIFNLEAKNNGGIDAKVNIDYITGKKIGYDSINAAFSPSPYPIPVSANGKTNERFDRRNNTHLLFKIGDQNTNQIGPDTVKYSFTLDTWGGDLLEIDIHATLPLTFDAGTKIVFKDTLPVDLTSDMISDKIDLLVIRLNYTTKLPVDGTTEVIFLDENNVEIPDVSRRILKMDRTDLQPVNWGFDSNVSLKEKKGAMYIKFAVPEWEAAKNIKSMVLKTTLSNGERDNGWGIHFRPADFLELKVDLFLKGNIKL